MSIAAYLRESAALLLEWEAHIASFTKDREQEYWRSRPGFESKLVACEQRYFPGLNRRDARTADTLPKLWAFIVLGIRDYGLRELNSGPSSHAPRLHAVYGAMHKLGIEWAPPIPFSAIPPNESLAELWRIANRLEREEKASAATGNTTIRYHGGRSYSVYGVPPVTVAQEEHNILSAFMRERRALDTMDLGKEASNPSRIIRQLRRKFKDAEIRTPTTKGSGYFISVLPAE